MMAASKQTIGSTPPLSSRERLPDAIYVRMTPRVRDVLDSAVSTRGVTCSELVRELIRAADYGRADISKNSNAKPAD